MSKWYLISVRLRSIEMGPFETREEAEEAAKGTPYRVVTKNQASEIETNESESEEKSGSGIL